MIKQATITLGLLFTVFGLSFCAGGGSSGTGITTRNSKSIQGTVTNLQEVPVVGAKITILETGDSAETNSSGSYYLEGELPQQVNLEIETETYSNKILLQGFEKTGESVSANFTIDERKPNKPPTPKITSISVTAKIVGDCNIAFENNRTIRQANALANNTKCPVHVSIKNFSRDGVGGLPFIVQHRACDKNKKLPWKTMSKGITNSGGNGNATLTYFTSKDFCQYKIVAPVMDPYNSSEFLVSTFAYQDFLASIKE